MSEQDFEVAQLMARCTAMRRELSEDHGTKCAALDGGTCDCGWNADTVEARSDALEAEVQRLKKLAAPNQREHDLLRRMHLFLSQEDLITQEEYAVLVSEHGEAQRLEDYDRMRARVVALDAALNAQRCSEAAAEGWRAEVAKMRARIEASEGALREARTLVAQPSLIESPRVLALIDALLPAPRKEFCESHLCVHGNKPIDCDLCVNTLRGEDADGGEEGK